MKFENTQTYNWDGALRGMRNPMDSWDKADSWWERAADDNDIFMVGDKDMALALSLIKGGTEHRKFLRQIMICVDITAPRYWWQEFDTYKVGTVANSCSTMHKLQSKEFSLDMFEFDPFNQGLDLDTDIDWCTRNHLNGTIEYLNTLLKHYNETKDYGTFRRMKQALPESFLQKRTITMNYENLLTIYRQRHNHRLSEWNTIFKEWAQSLPCFDQFWEAANGGKQVD